MNTRLKINSRFFMSTLLCMYPGREGCSRCHFISLNKTTYQVGKVVVVCINAAKSVIDQWQECTNDEGAPEHSALVIIIIRVIYIYTYIYIYVYIYIYIYVYIYIYIYIYICVCVYNYMYIYIYIYIRKTILCFT